MNPERYLEILFIISITLLCTFFSGCTGTNTGSDSSLQQINSETLSAEPGDLATIGYTIRDKKGRPVVTTDETEFKEALGNQQIAFIAEKIAIPVNVATDMDIVPMPVSHPNLSSGILFAYFGPELDAISHGLVGMHPGEERTVKVSMGEQLRSMKVNQFETIVGEAYADAKPGEQVLISFSYSPQIVLDNVTAETYPRTATVVSRDENQVTISYMYPEIDIRLLGIEKQKTD